MNTTISPAFRATFAAKSGSIRKTHRKENLPGLSKVFMALVPSIKSGQLVDVAVEVRIYRSTTFQTCTACIWVRGLESYTQGSGTDPGGVGYHKESAAVANAIQSAGITLESDSAYFYLSGRGSDAIREAVRIIAETVRPGVPVQVIETHP